MATTKITANLCTSQYKTYWEFDYEDLNTTKEDWEQLSEEEQNDLLQKAIYDLKEQPYWLLDKWKITE